MARWHMMIGALGWCGRERKA